jgi:superfamily II DNA helicase RecQ
MQMRFFQLPIFDAGTGADELNRFLRTHRVLRVQREMVVVAGSAVWAICVEYLDGKVSLEERGGRGVGEVRREGHKIDYRQVLSPEDFVVFSALRDFRRSVAQSDGVAIWSVFTNEQISQIAQKRPQTREELMQVPGVGDGRVDRYGEQVLNVVKSLGGPVQ